MSVSRPRYRSGSMYGWCAKKVPLKIGKQRKPGEVLLAAKLIIISFIYLLLLLLKHNLLKSSLHYNMLCCQRFSRTNFCKWVRCSRSPPNLPQAATICKTDSASHNNSKMANSSPILPLSSSIAW